MGVNQKRPDDLTCPYIRATLNFDCFGERGLFQKAQKGVMALQAFDFGPREKNCLIEAVARAMAPTPSDPLVQERPATPALIGEVFARNILSRVHGVGFAELAPLVFNKRIDLKVGGGLADEHGYAVAFSFGQRGLLLASSSFGDWLMDQGDSLGFTSEGNTLFLTTVGAAMRVAHQVVELDATRTALETVQDSTNSQLSGGKLTSDPWDDELRHLPRSNE